ncbi:hypothetical protein PUN28_004462 [Cardiocondyla obscurior]|uniref:Uncharacterized protein n=1 Tax=Cardiocondyla obscurior TaxID=286306 RepID=A0AAW2GCR8_9HYME
MATLSHSINPDRRCNREASLTNCKLVFTVLIYDSILLPLARRDRESDISRIPCKISGRYTLNAAAVHVLLLRGRCVLCMRLLCIRHDSNRAREDAPRRRPTP